MKKGISLIALLVSVAVISILITTITLSGLGTTNNAKKMAFGSEIRMLKNSIDSYKTKNQGEYPVLDTIILDVSQVTDISKAQFSDEDITDNKIVLYQIDYSKISIGNLNYGNLTDGENDMYVVSKKTDKVYYAKGVEIGGVTYYTITNDIEDPLNNNDAINNVSNPAIIFELSNTSWTNKEVNVKVKVPQKYVVDKVIIDNENIPNTAQDGGYYIYEKLVNTNTTVSVEYSDGEGSDIIKTIYNVTNIDKDAPILTVNSDSQTLIKNEKGENIAFFTLGQRSDELSGIDKVKYVNYRVDREIDKFFENNGNVVKGDNINIEKGVRTITVYARDKAGNGSVLYIDILPTIYDGLQ